MFLTKIFLFFKDFERVKLLKAEGNAQILMAITNLKETIQTFPATSRKVVNIDSLKDIAVIRATLDVLSTYLGADFAANIERFENLTTCLEAAKHLCSNPSQFSIQLFLLKQLVRNDPDGIDAVKEICKRGELVWILLPQAEVEQIIFSAKSL